MALDIVIGSQGVDQVQTVGCVGNGIPARVAHLIFLRFLLHVFRFVGDACLDVMMTGLMVAYQFKTHYVGRQVVTRMSIYVPTPRFSCV